MMLNNFIFLSHLLRVISAAAEESWLSLKQYLQSSRIQQWLTFEWMAERRKDVRSEHHYELTLLVAMSLQTLFSGQWLTPPHFMEPL